MTTIATSLRSARWGLALLGGVAGLLLTALPAQAQELCGLLPDAAENALDLYLDELDDEFSVNLNDGDLCGKLTQNFIKACETAVKDTVKCIQNQVKNLAKQNQTLCTGLNSGSAASECSSFYKNQSKSIAEAIAIFGSMESDECAAVAAAEFFDVCMYGF